MNKRLPFLLIFFLSACTAKINHSGLLGFSDSRRIVIVGERVPEGIATFYEKKYDALVWFTPSQGLITDSSQTLFKGVGPSAAMQALMAELKSINYTIGRWEIIVPKIAEKFFLNTLKHMPSGALAKARGTIVLIDSKGNAELEEQVKRIGKGNFFLVYEFQKY